MTYVDFCARKCTQRNETCRPIAPNPNLQHAPFQRHTCIASALDYYMYRYRYVY